jgi:hypothetical protein
MRRVTLLGVVALLVATSFAGVPSPDAKEYMIKITSSSPGHEVEIEGAYLFNGSDPALHVVRQATPFEARADGQLGMGIFRKTKGDAQIVVEVIAYENGKRLSSSRTVDDGVIFGHNLVDKTPSFTHSFTWPRQ